MHDNTTRQKKESLSLAQWIEFNQRSDERGLLTAIEENIHVPFNIKRVYYLYGTLSDVRRGFHAHKELRQILICVSGSCMIRLDDGITEEEVKLFEPHRGIFVDKMIWREMYDFSKDCVLLVLASDVYREEDYIRDYEDFFQMVMQ